MPKISCPGCQKQYNLAESAIGKVATCKACGKKFRVGQAKSPATPHAKPTAQAKSENKAKPTPHAKSAAKPAAPVASQASDSFWDEELPQEAIAKQAPRAAQAQSSGFSQRSTSTYGQEQEKPAKKKKKKKKRKVKWGADWGKVGGGLASFFIFGGIAAAALMLSGWILVWSVIVAIIGLFTALSGLMGEDGVW